MVIRKLVVFFSAAMSLSWAQTVATQQGEIIAAPRPSTASTALLFPYVAAPFGFDTEITISNTSRDTLGSTPQSGSCTLNYYGSTGSAPPPQTSSPIAAGKQLVFNLSQGASGIVPTPGFLGYIIADCAFPLARGYAKVMDQGFHLAFGQDAQVLSLPRSAAQPQYLLFPFVTDLFGYDTGIAISNTSLDPLSTVPQAGPCAVTFFGGGGIATTLGTSGVFSSYADSSLNGGIISAGETWAFSLSSIDPGYNSTPTYGTTGYAIADCIFSDAAGIAFVSDSGIRAEAASAAPELLSLPRDSTPRPLLFASISNQGGADTEIAIANTTLDLLPSGGATPTSGSCALNFYGANAPSPVATGTIAAGAVYTALASAVAPSFQGYVVASCSFPLARGWAYTYPNPPLSKDGDSEAAEIVTVPRSTTTPVTLLFSAATNWDGDDTNITISNTSLDPFGTAGAAGACSISYYGAMVNGGKVPPAQVSAPIQPGSQLSFTLSGGNAAQGIAPTPGFRGYVIAGCGFPLARGLATITAPPACAYNLSAQGQNFGTQGGLGTFTVNAAPTCAWHAAPNAAWITILASGTRGTAKVNYAVAPNTGAARSGSIFVGTQSYKVSQQGFTCSYSIGPNFASPSDTGGSVSVSVSAPGGCSWTAVANVPWLTIKSGASGSGGGVVVLSVAPNTGAERSGTATIAGQTFKVTEGAGACGALDVTSEASVTETQLIPIPFSSDYSQSIAVRNTSGSAIPGPVYIVLLGEPTHYGYPHDSFLSGTQLETTCFSQGDYLLLVSGDLQPGQTGGYDLLWTLQPFGRIQYTTKVLSGTPSH